MSIYYHITTKENADVILKEGLKPMIGKHSKLVGEDEKLVYLCKRKDIPYWNILLDVPVILSIDIDLPVIYCFDDKNDEDVLVKCSYDTYDEYIYNKMISADKIKRVYVKYDKEPAMKRLCMSYLDTLSAFAMMCADYYDRQINYPGVEEFKQSLKHLGNSIVVVMRSLDYSVCDKKEIREHMKESGKWGTITFLDKYWDTDKRLYQQLLYYPEDDLTDMRVSINKYFKKYLKGCLSVDTGGWCF